MCEPTTISGPTATSLGEQESHEVLLAAARHCVADAERDLVLADRRRDHAEALDLAARLDVFTRLERALDANAPARPRRAA